MFFNLVLFNQKKNKPGFIKINMTVFVNNICQFYKNTFGIRFLFFLYSSNF